MKEKRWLILLTTFIMMILSASVVFAAETGGNEESDYGIWFDSLRGDNYTWVFADEEEYSLSLDVCDLEVLGYTQDVELVWTVGQKNENGEITNIIQPDEDGIYTVNDAENVLDIDGVKMAESGFEYLDVYVHVMADGADIGFEAETTVQLKETEITLWNDGYWNGDKNYQWIYSDDAMDVYIRSKDYPLGSSISLQIDNMTLQKTDENAPEPSEVLEITHEESEWAITALDYGYADVVFELTDPSYPDNQYTLKRTLVCVEDLYEMIIYTDTNSDKMLPGETLELRTVVTKYSRDEMGNEVISVLEEDDYTVSYAADNDWLYTVEDGNIFTAKNHFGEFCIHAAVTINEEGKEPFILEMDYWITVANSYLRLALDSYTTEPSDAVFIDSLNPRILICSVDNPEGTEYEPGIVKFCETLEPEYYSVIDNYTRLDIKSELKCLDLPKTVLVVCYAQLNGEDFFGFAEIYIKSNSHVNWDDDDICDLCGKDRRPFEDVLEEEWYYTPVYFVYEMDIMTGVSETSFAPQQNLTRAQLASILYRAEGSPKVRYQDIFADVPDGQWYTDAVMWAQEKGIVTGYSNGTFGPHDNILREQIAVMMYRYAAYKGYYIDWSADLSSYADTGDITGYAVEGMQWAVGACILQGKSDGTRLDPRGDTTRAECAVIMQRFWDAYIAEK